MSTKFITNQEKLLSEVINNILPANRRPLQLIYYEACLNEKDATKRGKYLKTSWG